MQHENNRQRLERAFPPMDAAFDHAVRSTLENIVQEDTMQVNVRFAYWQLPWRWSSAWPARRWQWAAA